MDANPQSDGQADPERGEGAASEFAVRSREEIGGKRFRVGLDDAYVPFRNRKRRRRRAVAAVLGGLLVVGVGAYGLVNLVTAPEQNAAAAACQEGSAQALAAREQAKSATGANGAQFTLNVYNATERQGLAARTAAALKARGFVIGQVTNDPLRSTLSVSAQVRGGKASATELREVAAEVPGAQIQTDSRTDPSIDLVLGTAFNTLASPAQADSSLRSAPPVGAPSPAAEAAAADCGH
jgi:LytR cell envelope-related transcriptional attenuator